MNFSELLTQDASNISRKFAAQAIVVDRLHKQADLQGIVDAIKTHVTTGLKSGNPLYAGAAGAATLGGLSAVRESMRSKKDRNWGNVLTAAGLGGLGGAAIPALSGLGAALPTHITGQPGETGMLEKAISGTASAAHSAAKKLPVGAGTIGGFGLQQLGSAMKYPSSVLQAGESAAADAVKQTAASPSGASAAVNNVVGGVKPEALNSSLAAVHGSGKGSWNPLDWARGHMDRQIAARQGLPDIEGMKAMGVEVKPGQSPFAGNNRLGLLLGQSPTTAAPKTLYAGSGGHGQASSRVQMPMLGGAQSRQFAQGLQRAAPRPTMMGTLKGNLPTLLGAGLDAYNWLSKE